MKKRRKNIELEAESRCCCNTKSKSRRDDSRSKVNELEKSNTKVEARETKFEPETFESEATRIDQ